MAELLPCPFCGGDAKHYHRADTSGWAYTEWVSCDGDNCGCQTCLHDTKDEAVAAWNRRSHVASLVEALRFYLENWQSNADGDSSTPGLSRSWMEPNDALLEDEGRVARAALKDIPDA